MENIAKKKLDSLIKESKIRDCEDPNNFTVTTMTPSGKLGNKHDFKKVKKFVLLGLFVASSALPQKTSGESRSGPFQLFHIANTFAMAVSLRNKKQTNKHMNRHL